MRALFSRIWGGGLVHLDDLDPIVHLGDPDEMAVVEVAAPEVAGRLDVDRPPHTPVVAGRMDVPPERRPWDPTDPTRVRPGAAPIMPLPRERERACIDEISDRRCDAGDALTSQITALKALERRVAELERQVAAMHLKGRTS